MILRSCGYHVNYVDNFSKIGVVTQSKRKLFFRMDQELSLDERLGLHLQRMSHIRNRITYPLVLELTNPESDDDDLPDLRPETCVHQSVIVDKKTAPNTNE